MMKKYKLVLLVSLLVTLISTGLCAQNLDSDSEQLIKIETTLGNIVIKLYNETPGHRANMIKLIEEDFFKGQLFHRVIADFMIQGGDPHSAGAEKGQRLGSGGPDNTIPAEFNENLIHKKGALAAARQGDNMNPLQESSISQFYLVLGRVFTTQELNLMAQRGMVKLSNEAVDIYTTIGGSPHLDGAYTVFGEIVDGIEVMERIAAVATDTYDRPVEDVVYTISLVR